MFEGIDSAIFGQEVKEVPHKDGIEEMALLDNGAETKGDKSKTKDVVVPFRPSAEYRNFVKDHCNTNRFGGSASKFQRSSDIPTSYNNFLKRRTEYDRSLRQNTTRDITRCSDEFRIDVSIGEKGKSCPPIETVKVHIDLVNRVMGKQSDQSKANECRSGHSTHKKINCSQTVKFVRHRPKGELLPGLEGLGSNADLVGGKGT